MIQTITISSDNENKRLDKAIADSIDNLSRASIQNIKNENKIKLNGQIISKLSTKTKLNDIIEIDIPEQKPLNLQGTQIDLEILYEDNDIIVVNKPRGLTMYPGPGHTDNNTLVSGLLFHTNGNLSKIGGEIRPGIVHRLDKDTSGIIIVAKTDTAYYNLAKMFSSHDLIRKYTCFCWGCPNWDSAIITGNIDRHFKNRQKMSLVKSGGKFAETHIEVLDYWNKINVCKMHCLLKTGRTHQIRVHLSSHKLPVIGDTLYGKDKNNYLKLDTNSELRNFFNNYSGQLLHADTLEIKHPISGKELKFHTDLPKDMQYFEYCLNNYFSENQD